MFSSNRFQNIDIEKLEKLLRNKKIPFNKADSEKVLKNTERLLGIFNNVESLKELLTPFTEMINLLKDFVKGKYKDVPIWVITAIIVALLYVLSPADAIPDFIPGIGYIDDISIFTYCLSLINKELKKYGLWKSNNVIHTTNTSPA